MNDYLIEQYVSNLTKGEISNFANTNGITLKQSELDIIYNSIKQHWRTIVYGNPRGILNDLREQIEEHTYNKIEELYISFKNKFQNYL